MTGDFSLPFCQLKLQILFNTGSGEEVKDGVLDVLFNTAVADSRMNRTNWVGMVGLMNQDAVRQIRERAEKELLSVPMLESLVDDKSLSAPSSYSGSLETAKVCLTIIEELAHSVPDAGVPSIAPLLVEKMDTLLHKLVIMQTNFASFSANKGDSAGDPAVNTRLNFERGLAFWFSVLLRMVVIHRSAFMSPLPSSTAPKPNALHDQSRILISIFCISLARFPGNLLRHFPAADYFPHRPIQPSEYRPCPGILLQTHALDVAASLIDAFPDEARHNCARFLKEKCPPFAQFQNDPRFVYLLGPIPGGTAHTNISQQTAPSSASVPSPAASASAPTPTPTPSGASQPPPSSSSSTTATATFSETSNSISGHLRLQHHGRTVGSYPIRPWELLEDAAPLAGVNDTAISLRYFDARRVKA